MSLFVDILLIIFIVLGTFAGTKKGLIKTAVGFIGLVAIVILSYTFRTSLANFLIDTLPFFSFDGSIAGLTSLNILLYNVISFVVIFILLYCVLNIILALTGFIDTLLKFTVIWIIPSKIGGAILGFLEAWVFLFLVVFVLSQFKITNSFIQDSSVSNVILNNTPVIGNFLGGARDAAKEIYEGIEEYSKDESKTTQDLNLYILQIQINNGLISKEKAQELLDTGKIELGNVMFGKGWSKWLNI